MKKFIIFYSLFFIGFFVRAQDGFKVLIELKPEKIMILPGVYEFFGTISEGDDMGKGAYALSVNEDLVKSIKDSLERNRLQVLYGPKLELLVKEKILNDYAHLRKDVEDDLQRRLSELGTDKESKDERAALKKEIVLERKNTKKYLSELKKITERYKVRVIYVYGYGSAGVTSLTPKKQQGLPPGEEDGGQ